MTNPLVTQMESIAATAVDHHEFRQNADRILRKTIGYDIATWASMDPSTYLFTSCDIITDFGEAPHEISSEREIFAHEFKNTDPLTYSKIIHSGRSVARLRAEVEDPNTVDRFRQVLAPAGADDELRVVLRDSTGVWGTVTLYRAKWWDPFDETAERLMASIASSMARVYRHAFLVAGLGWGERPPGSLTLDVNGVLETTSESAERWLDTLRPEELRAAFATLTTALDVQPIARVTVAGSNGPVAFHSFHRKGGDGLVDVIVEQPRPAELAEVIMAAHGLTLREAEVARCVMHGMTTRAIGNILSISEYTVQDHLKSTFAKFDVVTRGELLHEVYSKHYLPKRNSDAVPGPYGYFIGDSLA